MRVRRKKLSDEELKQLLVKIITQIEQGEQTIYEVLWENQVKPNSFYTDLKKFPELKQRLDKFNDSNNKVGRKTRSVAGKIKVCKEIIYDLPHTKKNLRTICEEAGVQYHQFDKWCKELDLTDQYRIAISLKKANNNWKQGSEAKTPSSEFRNRSIAAIDLWCNKFMETSETHNVSPVTLGSRMSLAWCAEKAGISVSRLYDYINDDPEIGEFYSRARYKREQFISVSEAGILQEIRLNSLNSINELSRKGELVKTRTIKKTRPVIIKTWNDGTKTYDSTVHYLCENTEIVDKAEKEANVRAVEIGLRLNGYLQDDQVIGGSNQGETVLGIFRPSELQTIEAEILSELEAAEYERNNARKHLSEGAESIFSTLPISDTGNGIEEPDTGFPSQIKEEL